MRSSRPTPFTRWLACIAAGGLALACGGDPGDAGEPLEPVASDDGTDGSDAPTPANFPDQTRPDDPLGPDTPEPHAEAEPGAEAPAGETEPGVAPPPAAEPEPTPPLVPTGSEASEPSPPEEPGPVAEPAPEPDPPADAESTTGVDIDGTCFALCEDSNTDPDGDGWGWENEASCVITGSEVAAGRASCDAMSMPPETPDEPVPPGDAERPDTSQSSGFFVSEGRLYDANGNDFVIRGINHGHYWFRNEMDTAFQAIADTGANTIRIVWETQGSADELRLALSRSVDLELVPMIELHDVTGDMSNERLLDMARYYMDEGVFAVLKEFEHSLLVNIANEWSGEDWLGGYQRAIAEMRDAGLLHTLVVDANGWGQNAQTILDDGQALLESDPQRNLLFSVHMYQSFGNASAITTALEGAVARKLPLIVGEFGFQHGSPPTAIPYETILSECARLGLGYLPWSWKGNNSDVAYLDLSSDWAGNALTDWGRGVIEGSNGIGSTSQKASIFLLDG